MTKCILALYHLVGAARKSLRDTLDDLAGSSFLCTTRGSSKKLDDSQSHVACEDAYLNVH